MPYMHDAPVTPDTDPERRMPVPTGFPPRRTEEAPPLDDWQLRYATGYTFYHDHSPHSLLGRLFNYQSPLVVLPLQAISSTIAVLLVGAFIAWLWIGRKEIPVEKASALDEAKFIAVFLAITAISVWSLFDGRYRRMRRWLRFDWDCFETFAQCEAWMQYVGFMDWLGGLILFAWLLYLFFRTP